MWIYWVTEFGYCYIANYRLSTWLSRVPYSPCNRWFSDDRSSRRYRYGRYIFHDHDAGHDIVSVTFVQYIHLIVYLPQYYLEMKQMKIKEKLECTTCNVSILPYNWNRHIWSKGHEENVNRVNANSLYDNRVYANWLYEIE